MQGAFDPFPNKTHWGTKKYNYTYITLEPKISGMGQMLNKKKDSASGDKNNPSLKSRGEEGCLFLTSGKMAMGGLV